LSITIPIPSRWTPRSNNGRAMLVEKNPRVSGCSDVVKQKSAWSSIGNEILKTGKEMKVLGIIFDEKMTWTNHINKVIGKAKKLNSALRFIIQKLNKDQFLKVLTCQFNSACFYASAAWLHGIIDTKMTDER